MAPKVAKRPAARGESSVLKRPAVASLGSNNLDRKLVIVPMEGRRFTLDVLGSDTIDSVKEKIYDHTSAVMAPWFADGIVPELQRLKYYRPQFQDPDSPITHDHLPLGNQDCGWLLFL